MGCHTWIYKKVTEKEDCIRLIQSNINGAKMMIDYYTSSPEEYEKDMQDTRQSMEYYWDDVKHGRVMHDCDNAFVYMPDGRWLYRDEMSLKDEICIYQNVIDVCQNALDTLKSFEELKKFIIDHNSDGFTLSEFDTPDIDRDDLYSIVTIFNNEIYVNSTNIDCHAFDNCDYFRIYTYPCEADVNDPDYYKTAPAGKPVYGWSNAEDLIEFLKWYKNTKNAKRHKPTLGNVEVEYGEELYQAIREFFENNKDKNLLVHFG